MPKSQMERIWTVGTAIVALVLVVLGYFFFISPQRDQTSEVDNRVSTAQAQNDLLAARIQSLSAQNKNLATFKKAVAQASAALPATSGLPDFLRTLQAIGNATLTNVAALTVGPPTPYVRVGATTPTPTSTPTAAPTTSSAGTAGSAAGATPSAPAIYTLPVTAQVTGTSAHLSEFLRQLQSVQPRAVLISQISETTGTTSGSAATNSDSKVSLALTMSIFVQPGGVPGATVAQPTGTS